MYSTIALSDRGSATTSSTDRACDRCRRFKIRCRRLTPAKHKGQVSLPCDQCRRIGSTCRYDDKRSKRGRPKKRDSRRSGLPYDETVISFRPSPLVTFQNLPNVRTTLADPEGSELPPDLSYGDFISENTLERSNVVHGTAGLCLLTVAEPPEDNQHPDDHSLDNWNLMPVMDTEQAACTNFELRQPQMPSDCLESSAAAAQSPNGLPVFPPATMQSLFESKPDSDIWRSVQQFFETMHVIFPVLSYTDLLTRFVLEPQWSALPDLRTLLLAVRMVTAAGEHRMTANNAESLKDFIEQVERSRLCYDFAECPTLDEVIISLFLFTSYNVLEKHNRAFLYLDEALSLMETVQIVDADEQVRRMHIEQVLYNTEAASSAIYAGKSRRRRAKRPCVNHNRSSIKPLRIETSEQSERVALHLLDRLTEIHVAEDEEALRIINAASENDMNTLFGAAFGMHRYCRIQAADVAVSRQWQLSSKLVSGIRRQTGAEKLRQSTIEGLATAALAWVCLLKEGEPRIVGLGKLSGLAKNIVTLSGGKFPSYPVAGLVSTIIREDHERKFAPELADVVLPMVATIPSTLYPVVNGVVGGENDNERTSHSPICSTQESSSSALPLSTYVVAGEQVDNYGAEDLSWFIDLT
ncbi:hypothetical protein PV04_04667 [Phialophora macrospora]|uniref:Zn(2)-C6 fungal-type domain-containing protein n=1 Tax=Phialophora macrospora TaxID=1851006 RepID=A0A0D2G9W3_9EURO|nr:hypothetical protein PV04_04667 [Phialophora macrospora]